MIATLSLADVDYDESVCTLRYATRVRYIKNYVSANAQADGLIASFEKQIQQLQEKIRLIQEDQIRKQEKQYDSRMKTKEKKKIQEELTNTENLKQELLVKIEAIQNKIIVGGVNLLEKVEEQIYLLEQSSSKLKDLNENNQILEEVLGRKHEENSDLKQNYETLQEENEDLDRKILEIQKELKKTREEQKRQQSEQQFEIERKLQENKALSEDISLYNLVLNKFIPRIYKKKIESSIQYKEGEDEYRVKNVAYAGNHIGRKADRDAKIMKVTPQMKNPFLVRKKKS
ncbi:hypothetical protein HHI36_016211 [Cryptolaemus montrouzieri]|uniref:Kinesin motor domain-containing protein n=1 Tax=Cryptolaemus montrouzieri TaxID=559131 RepID=A0ABD2NJ14_9CUCU